MNIISNESIVFGFCSLFLTACLYDKPSRTNRKQARKFERQPALYAATKDSMVRSIFLYVDAHFAVIEKPAKGGRKTIRYYTGFHELKNDTFFLRYDRKFAPVGIEHYIIMDLERQKLVLTNKESREKYYINILSGSTNFK